MLGLFEIVADAGRRNAATLDVDYDPRDGHPTRIAIDYELQMADDEIVYTVRELRPL